jgi:hypothetical protein
LRVFGAVRRGGVELATSREIVADDVGEVGFKAR